MKTSASREPRARGFTLLEVLAAVAVLAIVYTSLARAAMQGLANQGDASRRLRASVLADAALGELEAQLVAGSAPPLGERDVPSGDDDFAISVEVRPFDALATGLAATASPLPTPPPAPSLEGRGRERDASQPAAEELLVAAPGAPPPLLEIDVRVRWIEGATEQEVTRTTFAADPAVVSEALAPLAQSEGEAGADQQGGDRSAAPNGRQPSQPRRGGTRRPPPPRGQESGQ